MSESKIQLQRWVIPVTAVLIITALVLGLTYFYQSKNKTQHGPTEVKSLQDNGKTPVAGGPGTEKYNKELRGHEEEESLKAVEEGRTHITIPIGKANPIVQEDVVEPEEAPKAKTQTVSQEAPKAADREEVQRLTEMQKTVGGAIQSEMQMIHKLLDSNYPEPTAFVYAAALPDPKEEVVTPGNGAADQQAMVFTPFEVGEVLYAMNTIAINSDVPGPAMIELVSGHLRGGKFIGAFVRHNKHLLLKLNAFSYEGNTYPVEALAVDPATSGVAMRSDVDSHYLQRWGGLVAASFIEGFASAISSSGLSTQSTEVGVIVDQPVYSTADQIWIAAGKVGENLAEPMLQNFYRPPTVYLKPGTEIGILIVKN